MSESRRALVRAAFNKLDYNGNGVITLEDLVNGYDSSANPEVASGRKTPDEVMREMLFAWDTQEKDGQVSFSEFEDYMEGVSASVDRDDLFEALMKRAWKLE